VKIKALDRYGKQFRLKAEGFLAQALEQEIEHLDGYFIYRPSRERREAI